MEASFQVGKRVEVTRDRDWGIRVGATIPRIPCLLKLPLQPVPCEQVHCREATGGGGGGVWLKHITYTVNHSLIFNFFKTKNYSLK